MPLLTSLIAGTNFAQFADFASPAFFKVMPMRKLMAQGTQLVSAYRDKAAFRAALQERSAALVASRVPVTLDVTLGGGEMLTAKTPDTAQHGEAILALYFHQLATPEPTLLDLAPQRFHVRDGGLVWTPGPGHIRWDSDFRAAMANVYACFYGGGDSEALRAALTPLGLAEATDLFIAHFGGAEQHAVRFEVKTFIDSFHAIFMRCKERGLTLHASFLPFGLYLSALYTTLEALGVPLDVRAAYAIGTAPR